MRFLEDFTVGTTLALGSTIVDRDEVIAFGRRFDPHPFHVGEEEAASTSFGEVIASGWHVGAMFMRMYVDRVLSDTASLGGAALDAMRLPRPVRPGDELHAEVEIVEVRPSAFKPDRGTLTVAATLWTDAGVVMTFRLSGRVARRQTHSLAIDS